MPDDILWDPDLWAHNYRKGTAPAKVLTKLTEVHDRMIERGVGKQALLADLQDKVLKICCVHGVLRDPMFFYFSYAEELAFRARAFEWDTDRVREYDLVRAKWVRRGLIPEVLDDIDKFIPMGKGRVR